MSDRNLLALRAEGSRAPLFLVVAPGVNALGYVAIARLLPSDQPIYMVQPTRRGRAFPAEGIGPGGRDEYPIVAAEYLASIRTVCPKGPYHFSGMCDGALIAFEMARLLEASGERVATLTLLDTWPLENTSVYPLVLADIVARGVRRRSPEERLRYLRDKAHHAWKESAALFNTQHTQAAEPSTLSDVAEALSEPRRKALWRAKLWPGKGFVPPRIEAPIAVLRAAQQPYWRVRDDALGWRSRTRGLVTVHILPGDHHTLARPPHVESWARIMTAYLDGALLTPTPRGRAQKKQDTA